MNAARGRAPVGVLEGTPGRVDRRPGLGFTTVSEPAKQLGSRVVRVGDQLGTRAKRRQSNDGPSQAIFEFPLAIACEPE